MADEKELTFDGYPHLNDLLSGSGVVGFDYYHVAVQNIRKAQNAGLSLVGGLPAYSVIGPKGTADVVLMCEGERISGANPLASVCNLSADEAIEEATGLARELKDFGAEADEAEALLASAKKPEATVAPSPASTTKLPKPTPQGATT